MYALRRVRDAFRQHRSASDPQRIAELLRDGERNLAVMQRQSLISRMYAHERLAVEAPPRRTT